MQYFAIAVVSIMVLFGFVAIVDLVFLKGRLHLADEFKRAFSFVGPLMLAMTGIICFVPIFEWLIGKTLTPLYEMMHLDPSMAVTTILAVDMGGYPLAKAVALDATIGEWAGMVYGSMMGATIVFLVPVGLSAIRKEDTTFFAKGVLYGIAAIPFGTFVGGLMMGIKVGMVALNLIIPTIFSIVIIICLRFAPNATTKVFKGFSVCVNSFSILALGLAIVKDFVLIPIADTGAFDIESVAFFNMLAPTDEGILISGRIALVLCGTLPFVYCLTKLLRKPLLHLSKKTGFSEIGMTSLLTTSANSMGMFPYMKDMSDREKIVNVAFAVCASWVIGDHLAYAASENASLIAPMIVAKLLSGIIAVVIALIFTKNMTNHSISPELDDADVNTLDAIEEVTTSEI